MEKEHSYGSGIEGSKYSIRTKVIHHILFESPDRPDQTHFFQLIWAGSVSFAQP